MRNRHACAHNRALACTTEDGRGQEGVVTTDLLEFSVAIELAHLMSQ